VTGRETKSARERKREAQFVREPAHLRTGRGQWHRDQSTAGASEDTSPARHSHMTGSEREREREREREKERETDRDRERGREREREREREKRKRRRTTLEEKNYLDDAVLHDHGVALAANAHTARGEVLGRISNPRKERN
jgi:hypothetical protein